MMDAMAAPAHCTVVTLQSVSSLLLLLKQQMPWCYKIGKYTDCNKMSGPVGLCEMHAECKAETVAVMLWQHDKLQDLQMETYSIRYCVRTQSLQERCAGAKV